MFKKLILAVFSITLLSSGLLANAASIPTGTYFLGSHPDGNKNPPPYGLRLDGLLGYGVYTFDFDHADSDMKLEWDGSTIHIYGTAFGGEDNGTGYTVGSTAIWTIDFTYDTGISEIANGGVDDVVVGSTGHHVNFGTLSSSLGSFDLRSHGLNNGSGNAFIMGDEDGSGHRGFDGISGWGWLDYSSDGINWSGSDDGCCSDWLFTVTPVPVPAAVWLFGSGLLGLVGVARRRA